MLNNYLNKLTSKKVTATYQNVGIGGFNLYAYLSQSITYKSVVPSHVLEDGSIASDHIIIEPITVMISGSVADMYISRNTLQEAKNIFVSNLGIITNYLPNRTQSQLSQVVPIVSTIQNNINLIDKTISDGQQIASLVGSKDTSSKTLRTQFFETIRAYFLSKTLLSVETELENFTNMAIVEFKPELDNQNEVVKFSLIAQQVEFAQIEYTDSSKYFKEPTKAVATQVENPVDKGVQAPTARKSVLARGVSFTLGG